MLSLRTVVSLGFTLSCSMTLAQMDAPDEDFEARLARIYKEFYSNRTSDSEWTEIVGARSTEQYSIQSGDTMWGISQTFFGNGFFWPKLWQLNADYTNPHSLEIGDSIQFSPGSIGSEPTVNLTQLTSKFHEPEEKKAVVTPDQNKAYMANIEMPPPVPTRPVVNKIPNSLPVYDEAPSKYDDKGFSTGRERKFTFDDILFLSAAVKEEKPDSIGEVLEAETGGEKVNLYQEAVVQLVDGKIGDKLFAFSVGSRISNDFGSAYPIEYQGEFEIVGELGDGKYRAMCTETITQIDVGAQLQRGSLPKIDANKSGPSAQIEVSVFGGHLDPERKNLGFGNFIYLHGGRAAGIQNGQIFSILRNHKIRNSNTKFGEPVHPIGLVKIIDVHDEVSTAYVLESREDIRPGDVTSSSEKY